MTTRRTSAISRSDARSESRADISPSSKEGRPASSRPIAVVVTSGQSEILKLLVTLLLFVLVWSLVPHSTWRVYFPLLGFGDESLDVKYAVSEGSFPSAYAICSPGVVSTSPIGELFASSGAPRIYTADAAVESVTGPGGPVHCITIEDRVVTATGSKGIVQKWCSNSPLYYQGCPVYVLKKGQSLLPGLHDAHGHVLQYGWSRTAANLLGTQSVHEVVVRLEEYVRSNSDILKNESVWIQGLGWDQTKWDPPVFPTSADLARSPLLKNRRIALQRIDVHATWVSDAALSDLSVAGKLPPAGTDVPGGLIMRLKDGTPSGVFIDKAMDLVVDVLPPWTDIDRSIYLNAALDGLLAGGITNTGDAAVALEDAEFFKSESAAGKLPMRIYGFLACSNAEPYCLSERPDLGSLASGRFTLRAVKLFADGALGSWGSAMWEDYADRPGERGLMLIPPEDIEKRVRYWSELGWQVGTHAIGDRANTLVLNAYEGVADLAHRPRIEHAQLLRLSDVVRFADLGVIASMQPTHCTSDMYYVDLRIGPERSRGAYAWGALLNSSARLAFGSDFPVELPDVVHGFYSSIARLDANGNSPSGPSGWHPEQRLTRAQTLHAFTTEPAFAQFEEHIGGDLSPGKRADFVLLDRDIMDVRETTPLQVRDARVLLTAIDGQAAWRAGVGRVR